MEKKNIRVLIVEDSPDDAYLVERVLRRHGFEPVCRRVESDEEMRAALTNHEWDVIISDYLMPEFNALGAVQICRESGLDVPFVVVSGSIGEDVAVQAMKAGVHDYMMKDNLSRLGVAVERELTQAGIRRERRGLVDALSNSLTDLLHNIRRHAQESLKNPEDQPMLLAHIESIYRDAEEALATIGALRDKAKSQRAE